ncbi:MAG: FAD-dependent oxidoreductase, partial [Verrucomicrobiota bacterium]
HMYDVEMESETRIAAVHAFDTRSGEIRRFEGDFFCDSTGHGYLGTKAGAEYQSTEKDRLGMSNMWTWENADTPQDFATQPWMLELDEGEFPYPRKFHAEWFWESGYNKDPRNDLEAIRDWNNLVAYSAWNAIKNREAYAPSDPDGQAHANARLTWMAYVGGTRETLQLLGDIILTREDIISKRPFPDGCVLTTWSIDLHYPKEQFIGRFESNPFIAYADHGKGVDRRRGYPVPYRCFYSRNIENMFMATRSISVDRAALGTIRVMKTIGMMGVVVGKAAAVAKKHETTPRQVYYQHLDELINLMQMPGNVRRESLDSEFFTDESIEYPGEVELDWVPRNRLSGIVIDDNQAQYTGSWKQGGGLKMYVEEGYHHSTEKGASARYEFEVPRDGDYEVRISHQPHPNRATNTPVTVVSAEGETTIQVDQTVAPPLQYGFFGLGVHTFKAGEKGAVVLKVEDVDGQVHADAVQVLPADR